MELNPKHPVTAAASEHWHKIAALVMFKLGVKEVNISDADMLSYQAATDSPTIVLHAEQANLKLKFFGTQAAALAYARKVEENEKIKQASQGKN